MIRFIELTKEHVARVNEVDYEYLLQWPWHAARNRRSNEEGVTQKIYMHIVVAERCGLSGIVDHKDRDSLNNRERKWVAEISVKRHRIRLGSFELPGGTMTLPYEFITLGQTKICANCDKACPAFVLRAEGTNLPATYCMKCRKVWVPTPARASTQAKFSTFTVCGERIAWLSPAAFAQMWPDADAFVRTIKFPERPIKVTARTKAVGGSEPPY